MAAVLLLFWGDIKKIKNMAIRLDIWSFPYPIRSRILKIYNQGLKELKEEYPEANFMAYDCENRISHQRILEIKFKENEEFKREGRIATCNPLASGLKTEMFVYNPEVFSVENFKHEIFHARGWGHEYERCDVRTSLKRMWSNIPLLPVLRDEKGEIIPYDDKSISNQAGMRKRYKNGLSPNDIKNDRWLHLEGSLSGRTLLKKIKDFLFNTYQKIVHFICGFFIKSLTLIVNFIKFPRESYCDKEECIFSKETKENKETRGEFINFLNKIEENLNPEIVRFAEREFDLFTIAATFFKTNKGDVEGFLKFFYQIQENLKKEIFFSIERAYIRYQFHSKEFEGKFKKSLKENSFYINLEIFFNENIFSLTYLENFRVFFDEASTLCFEKFEEFFQGNCIKRPLFGEKEKEKYFLLLKKEEDSYFDQAKSYFVRRCGETTGLNLFLGILKIVLVQEILDACESAYQSEGNRTKPYRDYYKEMFGIEPPSLERENPKNIKKAIRELSLDINQLKNAVLYFRRPDIEDVTLSYFYKNSFIFKDSPFPYKNECIFTQKFFDTAYETYDIRRRPNNFLEKTLLHSI